MTQPPIVQPVRIKPEGTGQTVSELKRVRNELKGLGSDAKSVGAGGGALNVARSAAGAAGGALATVGASGAGSAVGSILNLTAVLGPAGAALGAVTVGVGALTAALGESEQAHKARLDTERAIAREIGGLTTTQAQEKLRAAEEALRIDQQIANQQLANAALYNASISIYPLKLAAAVAGADPLVNAYNSAIAENNVALEEGETRIELYRAAIADGSTVAADAAAAARALADEQLKGIDLAFRLESMTAAQREERSEAIAREIEFLFEAQQANDATADTILELNTRIQALNVEYQALTKITSSYADELARVERANEAYADFIKQSIAAADAVTKAGEIVFKTQEELSTLEAEAAAKRQAAETKYADELSEIEAEGAEERAKIATDAADEIYRINRDLARSQKDTVRTRNVVASIQAREQAADALEDQKRADDKELTAQENTQRKQLASLQRAKQQELASVAEASGRELNTKRAALQQALYDLDSAKRSETFLATQGRNALLSIEDNFWKERIKLAQKYGGATPTGGQQTLTQALANGSVGQPVNGGVTVNVNNPGASSRQVGETVRRTLQQVWRD